MPSSTRHTASPEQMAAARRSFAAVVGAQNLFFDAQDQESYADAFAVDDNLHRPAGAIAPDTVEQIQAIVRIAAEHRIALWPISRGKNLGYGGSAPVLAGSVILDLSRMKKIEYDEENGTVLLEPGVGFYDLYDFLKARGLKHWLSTPGNSWGSVIGNALDRGVGYTPYGEHTTKLCGMEVVLADGTLVRTGMGALTNSPTWQLYRFGFGPAWDQMFVQSNFGIVTKAGLWLMPEPESLMGMDLEFDKPDDLGPLIDAIAPLRREGVLQQSPTIGNWLRAAAILTTRNEWTDQKGALSDAVIAAIRKKFQMGWWGVSLRLYGRETINREAYAILEREMNKLKPLSMKPTNWKRGDPLEMTGWTGTPITFPMQNANWHGGRGGHIGFSPVLPQSGSAAMAQFRRTYERYKEYGMDYQASFAFGERHLINVNAILLDKDDPAMMARVDPFIRALVADAKAQGYGEYRTHLDYMDLVASTYDFNDGALGKLNDRVKAALDPHGVIAPGKSGIGSVTRQTQAGEPS
ncbi:FAD linked oxidase-like protein [Sphingobium sp. SYK-6]|uniref:FAD-binding oxidoreductase n=1 Tax=Sphingobium sp. (strain NBRC 103272 / SYK-6) TaxID=627192 RepID=UPI0002277030|nr:FAD-binding oxidoreductase [Sphingobium sp. SYK-6]BAK67457.1 FAD linked oxidase-like protein [Sphingobium sp. SYK-6]